MRVVICLVICAVLLGGCGAKNAGDSAPLNTEIADDNPVENTDIVSPNEIEENTENRVYFNYPEFEATENEQVINDLILQFVEQSTAEKLSALSEIDDSPDSQLSMYIDYEITRHCADFFSVIFTSEFYHESFPHPTNIFEALIIDLNKLEVISLSDLYEIDADFVEMFRGEFQEQIRLRLAEKAGVSVDEIPESVETELDLYDDTLLLEILQRPDKSFMTDTSVGVSLPVGRALGDHVEIFLDYAGNADNSETDEDSDELDPELRQKARDVSSIFINAFHSGDEEVLRTVTTEEYFNDIMEFKRAHPTQESMNEAIIKGLETYDSFCVMALNGKVNIAMGHQNWLDFHGYFGDGTLHVDFLYRLDIEVDDMINKLAGQSQVNQEGEVISKWIDVATTLIYNDDNEFVVRGYGLTHS